MLLNEEVHSWAQVLSDIRDMELVMVTALLDA